MMILVHRVIVSAVTMATEVIARMDDMLLTLPSLWRFALPAPAW
jgi:hypothetical protein